MSYRQFAYYYDRLMADTPYTAWIRFVNLCWDMHGMPRTVVDLGCGTGNIAIPLTLSGMKVTGIDLSSDMLAVASMKSDELAMDGGVFPSGGSITWMEQDMREWQLPETVDCVLSLCDCMNYLLEEEDIVRTMKQVYDGLEAGGLFIFDVHTPRQLAAYAEEQPFLLDEEDIAYIWTCDFDMELCQIEHQLTIFAAEREGAKSRDLFQRIEETHIQRAYPLDWLELQLREVGFAEVDCFADFTLRAPKDDTERAFFVARKK